MKIEIKNIDDLFVKVKLLMGNADKYEGNGGLKIQCWWKVILERS